VSFRSGIYVEKFPERTSRGIAANSGTSVAWGRDGKKLYYRSAQGSLISVDVYASSNGITFGSAHEVFPLPDATQTYDVSPDGARILSFVEGEKAQAENELTVLLNWREALRP
jgi:hypothetical protein